MNRRNFFQRTMGAMLAPFLLLFQEPILLGTKTGRYTGTVTLPKKEWLVVCDISFSMPRVLVRNLMWAFKNADFILYDYHGSCGPMLYSEAKSVFEKYTSGSYSPLKKWWEYATLSKHPPFMYTFGGRFLARRHVALDHLLKQYGYVRWVTDIYEERELFRELQKQNHHLSIQYVDPFFADFATSANT